MCSLVYFLHYYEFLITGGSKLNCPRCGSVCDRINNAATTRFIKCEACSHLFVVLSENENKSRGGKSFPGKFVVEVDPAVNLSVMVYVVDAGYGLGRSLGDCRPALPKGRKYQMVKAQTATLGGQ